MLEGGVVIAHFHGGVAEKPIREMVCAVQREGLVGPGDALLELVPAAADPGHAENRVHQLGFNVSAR